jgi:phosphohistidine phosphatase
VPASTDVRRLVLLRHAKAEQLGGAVHGDAQRPLALVGRRQSGQVGLALASAGLRPDLVLCSSSLRTRQTWELSRGALGTDGIEVRIDEAVYHAGVDDLLEMVRALGEGVRTVLVVGHEPTMSRTAATLAGDGSDAAAVARARAGVPTATFSVVETTGPWWSLSAENGRLTRIVAPAH